MGWVEGDTIKVAVTGPPDTEVVAKSYTRSAFELRGKTNAKGEVVLSGTYLRKSKTKPLQSLTLRIAGNKATAIAFLVRPRLTLCKRRVKGTSPTERVNLQLDGYKVKRSPLHYDGGIELCFKAAAGATIAVGKYQVSCAKKDYKTPCALKVGGLFPRLTKVPLALRTHRLAGPSRRRLDYRKKAKLEPLTMTVNYTRRGVTSKLPLRIEFQVNRVSTLAFKQLEAGKSIPTRAGAKGVLYRDRLVKYKTFFHNAETLADVRYFASSRSKERVTGRCGPYRNSKTGTRRTINRYATDALVEVRDANGKMVHSKLFSAGRGSCPTMLIGGGVPSAKPSHRAIKRWLLKIANS